VKIQFNNVDFSSRSGPNGFGLKLARQFQKMGHEIVSTNSDVALNFIQGYVPGTKNVLRLDGIYFNTSQNWMQMNSPIKRSYDLADEVVVQSDFNRELVFRYFGERKNVHVIHNGTDLEAIEKVPIGSLGFLRERTWLCASSWRPHKRLTENIKYFQKFAQDKDVLFVAGSGDVSAIEKSGDPRVKYLGDLSWTQLISVMKASKYFVHLAYLDHCPNVVVDARASGCMIHCTSSGGTQEIAGIESMIVQERAWNFEPHDLYHPKPLSYNHIRPGFHESEIDVAKQAEKYYQVLRRVK
jgi:glycosyltransferase involved in cell wall biosynthesis